MNLVTEWSSALQTVLAAFLERATLLLPKLIGALLLLLIGWLLARGVRAIAGRFMLWLDRALAQSPAMGAGKARRLPSVTTHIVGGALFWLVMLFFVTAATEVLGLAVFTAWLGQLLAYLPTVAAGMLIMVFGLLASRMARHLFETAASGVAPAQRELLGRLIQAGILLTAVLVGADQIGIRVTFLVILASVVVSALVGAAALSVSLASRSYVANLIGSHYLRQSYHIGQQLRLDGVQGRVLEITATSLVLETDDGRVSLPAKLFNDVPITLVVEQAGSAQATETGE